MRLDKKYKIEKAASKDAAREIINSASLEGNKLIATDGKILAVVPVKNDDGDKDAVIPSKALAAARKGASKHMPLAIDTSGDRIKIMCTKDGSDIYMDKLPTNFPKWKQVLPKKKRKELKVKIDPRLLWDLCQALGTDKGEGVVLSISTDSNAAIHVSAGDAYGLIMPMRRPKNKNQEKNK